MQAAVQQPHTPDGRDWKPTWHISICAAPLHVKATGRGNTRRAAWRRINRRFITACVSNAAHAVYLSSVLWPAACSRAQRNVFRDSGIDLSRSLNTAVGRATVPDFFTAYR